MEVSGSGKSPNSSLSFRYNATNEELEELYNISDDEPLVQHHDASPSLQSQSENASPKKTEKSSSIIDKYFKSIKSDKSEKFDEKNEEPKMSSSAPKDVTSSPMKEYLNRLGKKNATESTDGKDVPNETWKLFHEFKFKIAQAVEDLKPRSNEDAKEKSVPRENSASDSEENSAIKDSDQQSVGDTDNQVSSLDSSIQNLSEISQPVTAKANRESSLPLEGNGKDSESTDDTHKNFDHNESIDSTKDFLEDSLMDVESGVEALEDVNIDIGDVTRADELGQREDIPDIGVKNPPTPTHFGFQPPPIKNAPTLRSNNKSYFFNFSMYFLTVILVISYAMFPNAQVWNGFVLGLWFFCLAGNAKQWLIDNYFTSWEEKSFYELKRNDSIPAMYTIPSVKEHTPMKKYEGWINHYRAPEYDPFTYHINQTTTAFMKLEGCNLRISYTRTKVGKRALWDEKIENVTFYQHRFYNLSGARVILMPKGLVKKRQWSKKYPICVILSDKENIQVLEKEGNSERRASLSMGAEKKKDPEVETAEANTSPEKKRKFVWRRREKSNSLSESEPGKEGLRHRIVRKMQREKKSVDSADQTDASTDRPSEELTFHDASADADVTRADDDIIEDGELGRIKDFLEEAETETPAEGADGEWSVHVKPSRGGHARLYLFARTGRDKHEWYRRLVNSIGEANASAETSASDERSSEVNDRDDLELTVFRVSEKDTVSFAKGKSESQSEAVTFSTSQSIPRNDFDSLEKAFWPYLFKIIQSKSTPSECGCRALPPELSWLNALLARGMFDVMRDPATKRRLQARVQRKLNTLKLPPFMSPLVVTKLSLSGACPCVSRVSGPAWDARGVWLDADVRYEGGATIELLTQINIMKLKERSVISEDPMQPTTDSPIDDDDLSANIISEKLLMKRKPAIFDSDVEDSAESSSDDDTPPLQPKDSADLLPPHDLQSASTETASSKKKFLRMVDKIATNKYFQTVTDYKYIKRALEGLSNTDIKLQIELCALEGRLAVNLPPPPHDRLWIGFRTNPQLVLKAQPAFGARSLRFSHITNWIEQKLSREFEKVLVLPNMEDFQIDLLTPTPVEYE